MSSAYPNFIFSPISVSVLLTLLLRASSSNSYNEIYQAMELNKKNLNSCNLIENTVEQVLNHLKLSLNKTEQNGLELELNNEICLKDGTKIFTNFLHDSHKFFGAKVKGINFKLGNNRTDIIIGKWIKDNTKSLLLKSKLMLDSFKADTNIVMFNSVYFTAQ
jgi:serine protease inhibitor